MKAVFKREFKSYFQSPIGYIVLSVYQIFLGLYFYYIFSAGASNVPDIVITMTTIVIFTVPVITMRLLSEDRKHKVDQVLFTAPIKLSAVVLGKFFAAFCLYAICFAPTVVFEVIIASYVSVSLVTYLYSLLGILLFGGALIAIGMFISSLTESMAIAGIVTLIVNLVILYQTGLASLFNDEDLLLAVRDYSLVEIVAKFANPLLSVPDIVFFLTVTAGFLFLTVRSVEKRRWA